MRAIPVQLHTAARRYLMQRHAHWTTRYAELGSSRASNYTPQQLDVFPRYNALAAILEAVERLAPDDWSSIDVARAQLAAAGDRAESPFTRPPNGPIELAAMAEERAAFRSFLEAQQETELSAVEPLPYRRVLGATEEAAVRAQLASTWGIERAYWYPLAKSIRPDVLAVQSPYFHRDVPSERLHAMLRDRGVVRAWELREHGPSYEIDLSEVEPRYSGAEGIWCATGFDWVLYASHESSITIGGAWLVEAMKQAWPAWERYAWTTPFF